MIDLKEISGIGEWAEEKRGDDVIYKVGDMAFLVMRPKTVEVRCDSKLSKVLQEKYESVMESRYFGRGGIEIVPSGQLEEGELEDLVRLSYNLTKRKVEQAENE